MQVQLLLADHCDSCYQAECMWRSFCAEQHWDLQVLDVQRDVEAQQLVEQLQLVVFPALLVNGQVKAVGLLDKAMARSILGIPVAGEPKL
jgi:hypothetical protein